MDITVETDMDRVLLLVRKLVIPLPYASANEVAVNLTLASNHCANTAHDVPVATASLLVEDTKLPVVSDVVRGTMPEKFGWTIDVDSERVLLSLGGHTLNLHFTAAAQLALDIRVNAKHAKAWAGDTSQRILCTGHLSDAAV